MVCSLQGWGQPESECRSANILLSKEGRAKIGDAGQAPSVLCKVWRHVLVDKKTTVAMPNMPSVHVCDYISVM